MSGAFAVAVEGAELCGDAHDGTGTPLMFVHGMAGDRLDWDAVIARLPDELPWVRYDMRGFGRSPATAGVPFSHAEDLLAVLDSRGIDRAVPIGLSMGGATVVNFALDRPDRVSRLALISPALVGWPWSDEWRAIWRGVVEAARGGDLALARERWWQHPMFAAAREGAAREHLRRSIERFPGRQWRADNQRPELPDLDRLHQLRSPTLLLTGDRDVPDMRLIGDVIAASAPDVHRIDMVGAGHMLHLERPGAVASALVEFVA